MRRARLSAESQLARFFRRNGCLRSPNLERRKRDGQAYHKGYEIRFTANDRGELRTINRLLRSTGFNVGLPYPKGQKFVQPVYGKANYERFLTILGA
jgi:hypothetical protein